MPRLLQRQRLYRRLCVVFLATSFGIGLLAVLQHQKHLHQQTTISKLSTKLEATQRDANLGNRAREQAEELSSFMLKDLQGELEALGKSSLLGEASRRTLDYFENLPPELVNAATQEARIATLETLSSVHQDQGDLDQAIRLQRQAVDLQQAITKQAGDGDHLIRLAESLNRLSITLLVSGKVSDARDANLEALELLKPLGEEARRTRANTLFGIGECERATGNPEGALNYYDSAISEIGAPGEDETAAIQTLMICHNNSGFCHMSLGDDEAAEASYLAALKPARRLLALQPEKRQWQREIATLLNNLGTIYQDRDEYQKARSYFEESLTLRRGLVTWDPSNSSWQLHYANSLRNLASLDLDAGRPDEALQSVRKSLRVRLDLLSREPDNTGWLEELQNEARRFAHRFIEAERPELAATVSEDVRKGAENITANAVNSSAWNQFLSKIYNDLGQAADGEKRDPVEIRLRSTALRAENVSEQPDDPEAIYQLAAGYLDLAQDLSSIDRISDALQCLKLSRFLFETRIPERFYRREALIDLCTRFENRLNPDPAITTLIPNEALWKYYDDRGSPGDDWAGIDFDDSEWEEGPAELGYGDGDEATLISFGPDPSRKHPSALFRHRFELDDLPQHDPVRIGLLCDDGASVFINGHEIIRHGLPDGGISPTTYANITVSRLNEEIHHLFVFPITDLPLRVGTNVIAARVHQNEGASSDLSFSLELFGNAPVPKALDGFDLEASRRLLGSALPEIVIEWTRPKVTDTP